MFNLQVIAAISTIMCVYLSVKQKVSAWPIGLVSTISLMGVYIIQGVHAQVFLQAVFTFQSLYGWYNWSSLNTEDPVKVTSRNIVVLIKDVMAMVLVSLIIGTLEAMETKQSANMAFMDALACMLALLGNGYLTKKIIESWFLFMAYNIILIVLLSISGLYILVALNVVLLILSIKGYLEWKKDLKTV